MDRNREESLEKTIYTYILKRYVPGYYTDLTVPLTRPITFPYHARVVTLTDNCVEVYNTYAWHKLEGKKEN